MKRRVAGCLAMIFMLSQLCSCQKSTDTSEISSSDSSETTASSVTETTEETTTAAPTDMDTLLSQYPKEEVYFRKNPLVTEPSYYNVKEFKLPDGQKTIHDVCFDEDGFTSLSYSEESGASILRLGYDGSTIYNEPLNLTEAQEMEKIGRYEDGKLFVAMLTWWAENGDYIPYSMRIFDEQTKTMETLFEIENPHSGNDIEYLAYANDHFYVIASNSGEESNREFVVQSVICLDKKGNMLYETERVRSFRDECASWFLANDEVYFVNPIQQEVRKFDSSGKAAETVTVPMDGSESIFTQNGRVIMIDDQGIYELDAKWMTWNSILEWENVYPDNKNLDISYVYDEEVYRYESLYIMPDGRVLLDTNEGCFLLEKIDEADAVDKYATIRIASNSNSSLNFYDPEADFVVRNLDGRYQNNNQFQPIDTQKQMTMMKQDFMDGKIDVLVLNNTFCDMFNRDMLTSQMVCVRLLQEEGYCLDVSPYLKTYIDAPETWNYAIPLSAVRLYGTEQSQYVIPVGEPSVKGLYSQGASFKADDTYAEWLSYAEKHTGKKKLLYSSKALFMYFCMACDLEAFIDRENNKAEFDCQEFKDLLEIVSAHCDLPTVITVTDGPYKTGMITDGAALEAFSLNPGSYSLVGYPSSTGTGLCMVPDQLVLVSASCKHPEEAWAVVENLLGQYDDKWKSKNQGNLNKAIHAYYPDPQIQQEVMKEVNKYLYEGRSYENTVSAINTQVQEILDKRKG